MIAPRTVLLAASATILVGLAGCGGSSAPPAANPPATQHHGHHPRSSAASATPTTSTSASPSPSPTPSPTATPTAIVKTVSGFQQFQSPTRNIGCEMDATQARCDIKQRTWAPPPKPASCPVDFGQGLQVAERGKGSVVCAGDTALDPKAQLLAYGHGIVDGPLQCVSESTGMTCENRTTGHGFFLARGNYRLF